MANKITVKYIIEDEDVSYDLEVKSSIHAEIDRWQGRENLADLHGRKTCAEFFTEYLLENPSITEKIAELIDTGDYSLLSGKGMCVGFEIPKENLFFITAVTDSKLTIITVHNTVDKVGREFVFEGPCFKGNVFSVA